MRSVRSKGPAADVGRPRADARGPIPSSLKGAHLTESLKQSGTFRRSANADGVCT